MQQNDGYNILLKLLQRQDGHDIPILRLIQSIKCNIFPVKAYSLLFNKGHVSYIVKQTLGSKSPGNPCDLNSPSSLNNENECHSYQKITRYTFWFSFLLVLSHPIYPSSKRISSNSLQCWNWGLLPGAHSIRQDRIPHMYIAKTIPLRVKGLPWLVKSN